MKPELARLLHHAEPCDSAPQAKQQSRQICAGAWDRPVFRDRKRQEALEAKIAALTKRHHELWLEKALLLRHVPMGSLDKITREYFACFEHGLASVVALTRDTRLTLGQKLHIQQTNDRVRSQEAFVRHLMDPEVAVGPMKGVGSILMILRRLTAGFARSRKVLTSLEVTGSPESPQVVAWAVTHAVVTLETFRAYFPSVSTDNELLHKYLHTWVAIESKTTFHFTREGRVERMATELNYMTSLVKSGWTVPDATRALQRGLVPKAMMANVQQAPPVRHSPVPAVLISTTPSFPSRGFLMALVRECCGLFGIAMKNTPPQTSIPADQAAKEAFLRRVLDAKVTLNGLVGVDAVIRLLLHTEDLWSGVRKTITDVSIAGEGESEPIVMVHMDTEISTASVVSLAAHDGAPSLWHNWNIEYHCLAKAQFYFTHDGHIRLCSFDDGCFEALTKAGVGLEKTCRVLLWFSGMRPQDSSSGADQLQQDERSIQAISGGIARIPPHRRRTKTSSERGIAFRARRQQYEHQLHESVLQLQATVAQLQEQLKELQGI